MSGLFTTHSIHSPEYLNVALLQVEGGLWSLAYFFRQFDAYEWEADPDITQQQMELAWGLQNIYYQWCNYPTDLFVAEIREEIDKHLNKDEA